MLPGKTRRQSYITMLIFFAVKKSGKKIALTIWLRVFCYFPYHPREKWRATEREHRARDTFLALGGGDWGLNKVKSSQSPPFECYFTAVIPPNNFWWLLWFPPPSSFSKKIWVIPSLNPSKLLSDPPFWVLSYDWSPLLFSLKPSDPPLNSSTPTLRAIIIDRSLTHIWCT